MIIREIKVGELPGFIDSELFKSINPKPITGLRAISQFNNPRAQPDDIALIIAYEGVTLLAFAGLLPDFIAGNPDLSASSNSGWWAHPEKGRFVALSVFARALKSSDYRMFMTDCTSHSREILEKTGWFEFREPLSGVKIIFRFYFQQMAEHRFGSGLISKTAGFADKLLDGLLSPLLKTGKQKSKGSEVSVSHVAMIDDQLSRFISEHNQDEFTGRSVNDIRWALNWKWLQSGGENEIPDYPFSSFAKSFEQIIFVYTRNKITIGLSIVNVRENHATIPYFYAEPEEEPSVWEILIGEVKKMKINTLTCFRPGYIRFLNEHKVSKLYAKQVYRHIAVTKELLILFRKYPSIQDGDGDCIFT